MGTVDLNSTDKVVIVANEFRVYDLFNPYDFGDGDIALIHLPQILNFTGELHNFFSKLIH